MLANFHTHTKRCNHAAGEDREYVIAAIKAGLTALGFSDHAPQGFEGGYYSNFRMKPEEQSDYIESISALREEFRDYIQLYIGYETEYYPAVFDKTYEMISSLPYDYMILGQHALDNERDAHFCFTETDDAVLLEKYVSQVCEGIRTGKYFYLAHPDVFRFSGDEDVYEEQMTRLCREANRYDMPLEINGLGLREGRYYPSESFFRIAAREGSKAIFGCDAHSPDTVGLADNYEEARRLADRCGIELIETTVPVKFRERIKQK